MKKINFKILLIAILSFVLLLTLQSNCKAASFSASSSPSSTAYVGDTITITIKATDAAGMYKVTASNDKVSLTSGLAEEFIENSSTTVKFKAVKAGTVTITATASDMTDLNDSSKKVTGSQTFNITIKEKSSTTGNTTGGNTTNTTTGGNTTNTSSGKNNTTSGGSTSNEYKPTFTSVNETVYATAEVNVRKSYSTSSTRLGTLSKGDSITRTGKSTDGKWSRVTYNGQTAYMVSSYLSTTKPKEEEKSSNKNLASLSVEGVELSPAFNKETTQYTGTASENVTKLEIKATAEDSKAKVEILDNDNLKGGDNIIKIKVTAEDDTVRTYILTITNPAAGKIDENKTTELQLANLEIKGVNFEEGFNPAIYTYELSLNNSAIKNLEITAKANQEDATVEIIGNENFIVGENTITILLTSADGTKTATYQIKVTLPEETTAGAEIDGTIKTAGYIIAGVIAATIIIMLVLFIVRHHKGKEEYEEVEDADIEEKNKIQEKDIIDIPQIGEKTKRSKGKHSM